MHIRLKDIDLYGTSVGDEKAPLIIALHGGRGTEIHEGEIEQFKALSDKFRLVAFDQRGCGRTPIGTTISQDRMIEDLEEARLALGGGKQAIVIGFSFGGIIGMQHALRYPDAVSHLITIGSPLSHEFEDIALGELEKRPQDAPSATREMVLKQIRHGFENQLEWRIAKFAMTGLYHPDAPLNDCWAAAANPDHVINLEAHRRLWEPKYDVRDRLGELKTRLLAISGERDWLLPPDSADKTRAIAPNARVEVVPGAGHSVHYEVPDLVVNMIREFVAS